MKRSILFGAQWPWRDSREGRANYLECYITSVKASVEKEQFNCRHVQRDCKDLFF
jgi:hypothetical protein